MESNEDFRLTAQTIWNFAIDHAIPNSSRLRLWRRATFQVPPGISAELQAVYKSDSSNYAKQSDVPSATVNSILVDLPRTPWLTSKEESEDLAKVLMAFAMRNPKVGYCQGMNLIVAIPLIVGMNTQEALSFLEKTVCIRMSGLLQGCPGQTDLFVFKSHVMKTSSVVERIFPDIHAVLQNAAIDLMLISFDAFLTLFSSRMPLHAVLRTWDFCILSHEYSPRELDQPSPSIVSCLVAFIKCFLCPLAQDFSDGPLIAAYHRRLASLSIDEIQLALEQAREYLPLVVKSLTFCNIKLNDDSDEDSSVFSEEPLSP